MTEDQINSIQTGEVAERILYTGGAGTGKTILAVEIARQHVSNGLDTTILCGSTFVAEYLKRQPQVSGIRFLPFSQRNSKQEKTDVLIVDEAQNILDLEGLAIIDDWVEGGIAEGRWRVFLDDNAQSKFSKRYDPDCHDELKSFAVINPPLVKNCRNTKEVVEWVGKFTGADIGVPTITTGKGVVIKFFDSGESEADYLGLIFSSLSGYDIRETSKIWERMKKINKGKKTPEFMSTHPSADNRIKKINEWVNDIIVNYPPIKIV